jgi:N-dimethylarginine dimethylaminohydrolase
MCPPQWFDVSYKINTFMHGNIGRVNKDLAQKQWDSLYQAIQGAGVEIELMSPHDHPDIVFTANAGLVWNKSVIPAKFFHPERQGEEPFYNAWFFENGFKIEQVGEGEAFEGEGDVVVREEYLFMGHSSRTTMGAADKLAEVTGLEVVPLELNPDEFYHLDTCMASQGHGGHIFYYPGGFTHEGREAIFRRISLRQLIPVSEEEALCFACNMIIIGETAIFPTSPESFVWKVKGAGLNPVMVDLSEFMKAGGAAKCLTLWLDRGGLYGGPGRGGMNPEL